MPKVSVAMAVKEVRVPAEWTEISMSDFICDIISLYMQSGNEHLCISTVFFLFLDFSFPFVFFGNGFLFSQLEQRVIFWRNACSSSGL